MSNIRVDRSISDSRVPCGMNSLLYYGNNWNHARDAFHDASPGYDAWNKPNGAYGVILSIWCDRTGDFVVRFKKGF